MKFLKEFKAFIAKGNVLDLAVAVIIGAAFGRIVASLVNDIISPVLGLILGNTNLKDLKIVLSQAVGDKPASTLNYGNFIQNIIDFLIMALVIFVFIKIVNKAKNLTKKEEPKKEEKPAKPVLTKDQELLGDILKQLEKLNKK